MATELNELKYLSAGLGHPTMDDLHQTQEAALSHLQKLVQTPWFIEGLVLAVIVVLGIIWLIRRKEPKGKSLEDQIRSPRMLGYATAAVFVGLFGGWAAIAPLASAALAPGVVSPEGYRKTIQHLEGGIVKTIQVKEGDYVAKGQELIILDETQARAKHMELRERYAHLMAMDARLRAEQTAAEEINFPEEILSMSDVEAKEAMEGQRALLASRRATREGREQVLTQRILQLEEVIGGLRKVIASQSQQIKLIQQEIDMAEKLYKKGLQRLPHLLALKRARSEIVGERATSIASIAKSEQEIGETRIQLLTMREQDSERVNEELTQVSANLAELRSQLTARQDVLERTIIRAPLSGQVMNITVTTENGVIAAGEALMDIVPTEAKLIIDAQIKPNDINNVTPGMRARVLLTAYRQRNLPQIHGVLQSISADRLIEDRSGEPYFLAKVEVDTQELEKLENVRLMPGMPAEVMVLVGERTLLDYLIRPLVESLTKSFRES